MEASDIIIAAIIIAGAVFLLYHSVWKKKGHCPGCGDHGSCDSKKK